MHRSWHRKKTSKSTQWDIFDQFVKIRKISLFGKMAFVVLIFTYKTDSQTHSCYWAKQLQTLTKNNLPSHFRCMFSPLLHNCNKLAVIELPEQYHTQVQIYSNWHLWLLQIRHFNEIVLKSQDFHHKLILFTVCAKTKCAIKGQELWMLECTRQ